MKFSSYIYLIFFGGGLLAAANGLMATPINWEKFMNGLVMAGLAAFIFHPNGRKPRQ
jgi:hypothetical protein